MQQNKPYEFPPAYDPRLNECITLWHSFVQSINGTDRIGIVFHGDFDGLMGATYIRRVLLKHIPESQLEIFWISTDEYDFNSLSAWVDITQINKCVFADISIENSPAILDYMRTKVLGTIFIYDHHLIYNSMNINNVLLANPTPNQLQANELPLPTFIFAYRLAQEEALVFPDWLVLLSIFAEGVDDKYASFVRELFMRLNIRIFKTNRETFRRSPLSEINSLLRAEFSSFEKDYQSLDIFDKVTIGEIQSLKEVEKLLKEKYQGIAKSISDEISYLVDLWKNKIENTDFADQRVVFVPLDAQHAVSGPVASILRGYYPDKVIITYYQRQGTVIVELRTSNNSPLNLVEMLRIVATNIDFINYGGHPSAAGASFTESSLKDFKEQIEHEILQH